MGAAARLHGRHLHGRRDVADIEDADTPKAIGVGVAWGTRHALRSAVDAAAVLLDRHEKEVPEHGQVTLPAGADDRGGQGRVRGIGDVPDGETVEATHEGVVSAEGEIRGRERDRAGHRRVEESGRLVPVRQQLHVHAGRLGIEPAGAEPDSRVGLRDRRGNEAGEEDCRSEHTQRASYSESSA
jgi:hypothetical protein